MYIERLQKNFAQTLNMYRSARFDVRLKVALLFALPPLFGLWLAFSVAASALFAVGYGFFTPWVSAFEAFREEANRFQHCLMDGTWETIKGSCTVVRDFTDFCFFTYPQLLKELCEGCGSNETHTIRLIHVPGIVVVGLVGLIVEIPLYTLIAVLKSPYMLFMGWQRLVHDLISREGPFLETMGKKEIWEDIVKCTEMRGKEQIDAKVITAADLNEWLKSKNPNQESVVGVGVPCYALFVSLVNSIKASSRRLVLTDGVEVTPENMPQDRLLEWFFQPLLVIREQIKAIGLSEGELMFISKLIIMRGASSQRMESWDNGSEVPQDALKLAQIQAISRRLVGMARSMSMFSTYRRRFRQVVKNVIVYSSEKEISMATHPSRSVTSLDIV